MAEPLRLDGRRHGDENDGGRNACSSGAQKAMPFDALLSDEADLNGEKDKPGGHQRAVQMYEQRQWASREEQAQEIRRRESGDDDNGRSDPCDSVIVMPVAARASLTIDVNGRGANADQGQFPGVRSQPPARSRAAPRHRNAAPITETSMVAVWPVRASAGKTCCVRSCAIRLPLHAPAQPAPATQGLRAPKWAVRSACMSMVSTPHSALRAATGPECEL